MHRSYTPLRQVILLLFLVSLACNIPGGSPNTPIPDTPEADGQTPTSSLDPTEEPGPLPDDPLDRAKQATIRIVATGSFENYEYGELINQPGQGSGFIIDPSGIAVTSNHVVGGSAYREIWVGDDSEPRGAKILGVSECSDLAVIQIDGDGPFPYLDWYNKTIETGLDVYALGFPSAGNTELTVNKGIVSKVRADVKLRTSSVDKVIEHDALINRGNSGGPLIDVEQGLVVGINYAADDEKRQFFAIAQDEARKVIDELRQGRNVDAIGINGEAVILPRTDGKKWSGIDEDLLSGIWISAVEPGSPASTARIQAGDLLLKLQGLLLATDGTMNEYCKVLRSRSNSEATLSIVVYRPRTAECLRGEINGNELEKVDCKTGISLIGDPEANPGETPTAIASGLITTDQVNLRAGPGTNYPAVAKLGIDEPVTILQRTQTTDWLEIETQAKKKGWVASELIKLVEGNLEAVAVATNIPAPSAPPVPSGPGKITLWGAIVSGSVGAGADRWHYFDSGKDNNATLIAFMRNAEQVDLFIYDGNKIPNWPPNFQSLPPNLGAGTQEGNRDNDDNTKEFVWTGPISTDTRYYVQVVNRGNNPLRYCIVSRPDGVCSP